MSPSLDQLELLFEQHQLTLPELLALRRELKAPFKLHPLGFIACTLLTEGTRKLRLHFWPATGGAQQSPYCQIHDHIFEFRSWVLKGTIENIEYIASPLGSNFSIYRTAYSGARSILTKSDITVRLAEKRRCIHAAGSSYTISAGILHETAKIGDKPSFTALITNDIHKTEPIVLGPVTGLDSYVYERAILDEAVVEAMLSELEGLES